MKKDNFKPLISIIIPIYNVKSYVVHCVDSVISQDYKNLEIILVDDGSTDGSSLICDDYAKLDSRVKVIHKINGGLVSARKAGTKVCTGDYVLNVDGDDWIESSYVMSFVNVIIEKRPDVVWNAVYSKDWSDHTIVYCPNKMEAAVDDAESKRLAFALGKYGFDNRLEAAVWSKCVRRNFYSEVQLSLDDRIRHHEDLSFTLRLLSKSPTVCFIDEVGYHYVQRCESITNKSGNDDGSDEIMLQDTLCYLATGNSVYRQGLETQLYGAYGRVKMLHQFDRLQGGKHCLVPYSSVFAGERVVVYGAGLIGKIISNYIIRTECCKLLAVVDKNARGVILDSVKIESTDSINSFDYDKIIVATTKSQFSKEIKEDLQNKGVQESKIAMIDERCLREAVNLYLKFS